MKEELNCLNDFFQAADNCSLEKPFLHHLQLRQGIAAEGWIKVTRAGKELTFKVEMPNNFPLYGLSFYYQGKETPRHLLREGLVCLDSPFSDSFNQKLAADFAALLEWVDKYFLGQANDHYEYLTIPARPLFLIFDEEETQIFPSQGEVGTFDLIGLPGQRNLFGAGEDAFLADKLGGKEARWSGHYKQKFSANAIHWLEKLVMSGMVSGRFSLAQYYAIAAFKQLGKWPKGIQKLDLSEEELVIYDALQLPTQGLYIFIENEPTDENGKLFSTLRQVWDKLQDHQKARFWALLHNQQLYLAILGFIPLAIGYKIPNRSEIHWEWVLLNAGIIEEDHRFLDQELIWGRTVNAARSRFFGRGNLSSKFTESKILLLGCGALGSSLAETLVRGGIHKISLSDHDHVETGNICRSTYQFTDIYTSKINALARNLTSVSPYVEISGLQDQGITPLFPHQRGFAEQRQLLSQFDLIIDCTANDAIAWMLDEMKLPCTVLNLSISDEAKHLMAIVNRGNTPILPQKQHILASLGQAKTEATFYEGAGCWHPTFLASFADINLLLQHYIADANQRFLKGKDWTTTILETKKGDFGIRVIKREDI